jgi:hypothetical protein
LRKPEDIYRTLKFAFQSYQKSRQEKAQEGASNWDLRLADDLWELELAVYTQEACLAYNIEYNQNIERVVLTALAQRLSYSEFSKVMNGFASKLAA